MTSSHRISVLGRELQVRSAASAEKVREIEAFVNGKVNEIGASVKSGDTQLVAILALMNMAESYLTLSQGGKEAEQLANERLSGLLQQIDNRIK